MRRFMRPEVRDVYKGYVEHLKNAHPELYEEHKKYLQRYAI